MTYLETIISADGKPDSDIQRRYAKGISAGNQILGMLNENFSFSYFETAMVFRNSILVNGVLSSLEAVNFLSPSHLDSLEKCDNYLMSKLFLSGSTTPSVSFFMETGSLPLRFVLMGRRVMFYFQILKKENNNELVSIISNIQRDDPISNDWILLVKHDLSQLDIKVI